MNQVKVETRGRKKKVVEVIEFDKSTIKFSRGSELRFNDNLFIPMKTGREIDVLLSTEGGLMPATNSWTIT